MKKFVWDQKTWLYRTCCFMILLGGIVGYFWSYQIGVLILLSVIAGILVEGYKENAHNNDISY